MTTNNDIKLGVSLYCYQDNYYFHKHDLEGCIAAAAGAGAEGIEVFPESMIPEWPYISDAFVDKWNGWMRRYDMKCVCVDHFSDRQIWKNKQLTDDELVERSKWYIDAAAKLGAGAIRVMHSAHLGFLIPGPGGKKIDLANPDITTKLLDYCAQRNVKMALECHSPTAVDDPVQQAYLEPAAKLGMSEWIGLQVDFSSYQYRPSAAVCEQAIRRGANREIVYYIRELREKLKEFASSVIYVHGKFYNIDENGEEDSIDYHKCIGALKSGGYKGYICSEFEGNRLMNDAGWVDEIEFVRKHHVLMRKCLSE
jgi:sugar phosphate isomerase/epimerase